MLDALIRGTERDNEADGDDLRAESCVIRTFSKTCECCKYLLAELREDVGAPGFKIMLGGLKSGTGQARLWLASTSTATRTRSTWSKNPKAVSDQITGRLQTAEQWDAFLYEYSSRRTTLSLHRILPQPLTRFSRSSKR
jgi:hypothetical protein